MMVVAIRRKYYTALLLAPNVTTDNNKKNVSTSAYIRFRLFIILMSHYAHI